MKGRYTLTLLVLNLIVFGTIAYLHILKNNQLEEVASQSDLFSLNLNEIDYLEIRGSDLDTPRILQKRNGDWLITSPTEWRANLHAVNRLLNQIRWLKPQGEFSWEETRSFGQTLENYGLSGNDKSPRLAITIGVGDQRETLRLGSNTTVGKRIYALSPDGQRIYVLPQKIEEVLLMQMDELRSRAILSIPLAEISALRIQNREGENRASLTTLIREGKQWNFETPIRARASSLLIEETLNRLNQMQAIQFLDLTPDQFEQYGVASGKLSILLEGNNQRETLLIGNQIENEAYALQGPHVYARITRFPTVFIIPSFQLDRLYEPQVLFRERRILDFKGRIPNEIRIREQDRELSLQKPENGAWQFLRKNDAGEFRPEKADPPLLDFIVDYLDRLRVLEFVMDAPTQEDLNRFGLNAPIQEITILNPGEQTLLIGGLAGEDGLYAQKKGEPFVYKIPDMLLDWITSDPLFYRDRILQRLPSGAHIQSVSLTELDTGSAARKMDWQFNGQDSASSEEEDTESILKARTAQLLRELEVDRYIAETFQEELRIGSQVIPWIQKLSITWSLRGGDDTNQVSRTFYFSPKMPNGLQYGGSPELNVIFTLTPVWTGLLDALQDYYAPVLPQFGPPPGEAPQDPLVMPLSTPPQQEAEPTPESQDNGVQQPESHTLPEEAPAASPATQPEEATEQA